MKIKESTPPEMDGLDFFIMAVEDEFRRINPGIELDEVREDLASRCMDRWLILDGREKTFFSKKQIHFKNRRNSSSKKRRSRDPNKPKRALTAYLYFCKEERRILSRNGSSLPLGDITREIAKRWKQVLPEQRQHFEQLAAVDRQRYQAEMEAFRNRRLSSTDDDAVLRKTDEHNEDGFENALQMDF